MKIPFRGIGDPSGAWQLLVTNNTLNLALIIGVAVMGLLVFGADEIAGTYIVLPLMYVSGAATFLLPLALVFLLIRRTRKAGGLFLYLIASFWMMWLWLFTFLLLYQTAGKWFTLFAVAIALASSGLGLFAAFALFAVVNGQWTSLLIIIGSVALCRVVSNAGKSFMGLKPSQRLRRWIPAEYVATVDGELVEPPGYTPLPDENLQELSDRLKHLEDRQKNSSTMTIREAEEILDITRSALQDESDPYYHRASLLKGYDVFQIDKALKLRIANEFLCFADRDDGDQRFTEGLNTYSGIPFSIANLFVPDDQLARLEQLSPDSPDFFKTKLAISPSMLDSDGNFKDGRLASLETTDSFGNFCRSIGASDPNYWKKVYERIGLEYSATSPPGNEYFYVALPDD